MASVEALLRDPRIWRGAAVPSLRGQRTGFAALDRLLPQRGWPSAGLIEVLPRVSGCGELGLVLPALRANRQCWVAPPWLPYAPALARAGIELEHLLLIQDVDEAQALWALEQVARSGVYAHVLGWLNACDMRALRRLQLAAEKGGCRLFLFRPARCQQQSSPAVLRVYLEAAEQGIYLRILKCRGGRPAAVCLSDAVAESAFSPVAAAGTVHRVA